MPTTFTEGARPSDWLKGEQETPLHFSRQNVTLLAGSGSARDLKTGTVMGKVEVAGATSAAAGGNTGNGVMGSITVGAGAKPGVYQLVIIEPASNAGAFKVEDPDGIIVGTGNVASAFSGGGLSFTLADGGTDFVSGDRFLITVAPGSGKFVPLDLAGTDGRQNASAVLLFDAAVPDGTDAAGVCIVRNAVIDPVQLTWPSGAEAGDKAAGLARLAALGIAARKGE